MFPTNISLRTYTRYNTYSSGSEVYKFVAWGSREDRLGQSNLDLPKYIYVAKVSAQLPSNKTKLRPYSSSVNKLRD